MRTYQGYIYIALEEMNGIWKWKALKTNKEGLILSTFSSDNQESSITSSLSDFSKWIGNVVEYRIVAFGHLLYHSFFSKLEKDYSHVFSRHMVRMMKAQLWNVKSECMYRFQIKHDMTLEGLLFLYNQDLISHPDHLMQECINLRSLTNLFLFDSKHTKKLMKRSKLEVIESIYRSYSVEEILFVLLNEGMRVELDKAMNQNSIKMTIEGKGGMKELEGTSLHELLVSIAVENHYLLESDKKQTC